MELQSSDVQSVTAIISQKVRLGREEGFEVWAKGIAGAAQQFAGHQGVTILRPQDHAHPEYVIILRFDTYTHLRQWLDSDVRQDWIERSHPNTVRISSELPWMTI